MQPVDSYGTSLRRYILFIDLVIRRAIRNAPWVLLIPLVLMFLIGMLIGSGHPITLNVDIQVAPEGATRVCWQNPYVGGLTEPLTTVAARVDAWLYNLNATLVRAATDLELLKHDHSRFFAFDKSMVACKSLYCVGGPCNAESKLVCGVEQLRQQDTCIIYSIGGNNQWNFELDALEKTPCQVHTFDCTGPASRFQKPNNDRLHFHHVCLGPQHQDATPQCAANVKCGETWTLLEIQQKLGHDRIDLLQLDVEGFEWDLLESWPLLQDQAKSLETILPMQLVIQIHYQSPFTQLAFPETDFKFPVDMVNLQTRFLQMGYVVVKRDDNPHCPHCTELTLVRYRCPNYNVYAHRRKQSQVERLPDWFRNYMQWHSQQLVALDETNWQQQRYLVMRCLDNHFCGGAADRLEMIPFIIFLAAKHNRILFIKWTRPCRLEEFLLPPAGGLNWSIPSWMNMPFSQIGYPFWPPNDTMEKIQATMNSSEMVIDIRYQDHAPAQQFYNDIRGKKEPTFEEAYRSIWEKVFEPSPGVAEAIKREQRALGLDKKPYVAVHIRSQFSADETSAFGLEQNAANCASNLGQTVFVATDSASVTKAIVDYGNQHGGMFVSRSGDEPPLHLDRGGNFFIGQRYPDRTKYPPSAYYSVFVDLYLMAQAQCVARHLGNFGDWARMLSPNPSCSIHVGNQTCEWKLQ